MQLYLTADWKTKTKTKQKTKQQCKATAACINPYFLAVLIIYLNTKKLKIDEKLLYPINAFKPFNCKHKSKTHWHLCILIQHLQYESSMMW